MMLILAWTIIVIVSAALLFLLYTWFIESPDTFLAAMFAPVLLGICAAFIWALCTVLQ